MPTAESTGLSPVCGCDHVTYWNSTLAEMRGVNLSDLNECTQPKTCGGALGGCSNGARCNVNVEKQSGCAGGSLATGACWVVPNACPKLDAVRECSDLACISLCQAITNEHPYYVTGIGTCTL
jgi:hypothetical protein